MTKGWPSTSTAKGRRRAVCQVYSRQADAAWLARDYDGLGASARLDSIHVALSLAELYEGV